LGWKVRTGPKAHKAPERSEKKKDGGFLFSRRHNTFHSLIPFMRSGQNTAGVAEQYYPGRMRAAPVTSRCGARSR
jgi:hypothetical protein